MELAGKVIAILEARSGQSKSTGNPWMTQDYVIETHDQYPRRMVFNVFGEDKIKQFNIQVGEELNVSFDINAREYNGRWFNDIRAWKVDRVTPGQENQEVPQPADINNTAAPTASASSNMTPFESSDSTDDLPF